MSDQTHPIPGDAGYTPTTIPIEIVSRWDAPSFSRKGSLRATTEAVRAKLVHTSRGGRRIELFLTKPLMDRMGWREGGFLKTVWKIENGNLCILLSPAHSGKRAVRASASSSTCRVAISGDFINRSACAPVRTVPHTILASDGSIYVDLPAPWAANEAIAIRDNIRKGVAA